MNKKEIKKRASKLPKIEKRKKFNKQKNLLNLINNSESIGTEKNPIQVDKCELVPKIGRIFTKRINGIQKRRLDQHFQKRIGYKYFTIRDVFYSMTIRGLKYLIKVPKGFLTDGCSGPGIDVINEQNWLLHDFFYATHSTAFPPETGIQVTREEADSVLDLPYRRWAVRLFGDDAWESSYKRGLQIIPYSIEYLL